MYILILEEHITTQLAGHFKITYETAVPANMATPWFIQIEFPKKMYTHFE